MVGRLDLGHAHPCAPLDMSCRSDRGLDSPDSGLPPSPSAWLLASGHDRELGCPAAEEEARATRRVPKPHGSVTHLYPTSYGEGIQLDLPPAVFRYTSSLCYYSKRHFIHDVSLQPRGLALELFSHSILAMPHSTWRHYKTRLEFLPRQRPQRHQTTTIVYPKQPQMVYTTLLHYDCHRMVRRFISSVELEPCHSDCQALETGAQN